jgi:hypothetical protein
VAQSLGKPQTWLAGFVPKVTPGATLLALIAAGLGSGLTSYPGHKHLPSVALDSGALYYTERAVLFFAVLFIGLTLLGQGLRGRLATNIADCR